MSKSALSMLDEKLHGSAVANRPTRASFEEFLREDARVPIGGGEYGRYSFEGREALLGIVRVLDEIIAKKKKGANVGVAGGAQFGKTQLELNFAAYVTSQLFFNVGIFLPDVNLVAGVIDTKFRPDVVDQIPWYADMVKVGKAVNNSGKAVDRKGAFTVTDGRRRASGMAIGLQKVPTTFSLDVGQLDEVDDIPEKNAKYVRGRLTNSQLQLIIRIGTQRVHGRGQNKVWKDGSQGVVEFAGLNPEETFPGIVRHQLGALPSITDPKLTWAGDFRRDAQPDVVVSVHKPGHLYYLADPATGTPLDRHAPDWVHRRPERIEDFNWSFRISQLGIAAIGLDQIVAQFQLAVADPDEMIVFRCDVLALPQSTTQALTPHVIERAQAVDPFDLRLKPESGRPVFAGIDVGDKSYFFARERESAKLKRAIYVATISSGDLVARAQSLVDQLGVSCLFIDQRPEADLSRSLALALNGLNAIAKWPDDPDPAKSYVLGGLSWNGDKGRWFGLRCAVVRFDKKQIGAGIEHGLDIFEEGGQTKFVPLIRCNRQDSIDRVVREFLTPAEGVSEYFDGRPRELPSMLLPRRNNKIVETLEAHLITGSEREKLADGTKGDYVDQCANHFLLADAYSALAEGEGINSKPIPAGRFVPLLTGGKIGHILQERRERRILG